MTVVYPVKSGLYVNLTNRCPCACDFCIRRNSDGAYGSDSLWLEREPDADEVMAAIEAANVVNFSELVFCGYGEPTERLDVLLEVARRMRKHHSGVPIRVNTNGLSDLINAKPTATLFTGLIDVVSISLNAATSEEYEALCHPKFGADAYPAMLRFAAEVRKCVPSVVMTVVQTPAFTAEKRMSCETICRELGVTMRIRAFVTK